ncbi:MAG: TolC family protein [Desulfobacterota bacterium]|nr:TolC family protein [Thermodesulfobacteriota bacterium]
MFVILVSLCLSGQTFCSSLDVLSLTDGLKKALQEENLIKIKEYEEAISLFQSKVARSYLFPQIGVSYGKVFLSHEPRARNFFLGRVVEVPVSERDFHTYSITIRQLVFDFFGTFSLYRSKKVEEDIKRIELLRVKNSVAFQFLCHYYDLKEKEKLISVLEKEVERLESHLNDAKALYEEGVITRNEVLYTEVLLSDARQRLNTANNSKKLTVSILKKMMGKEDWEDLIFEEPKRTPLLTKSFEDYLKEAHSERPELRILSKLKDQLSYIRRAKKSEILPKFYLEGKYTYTENRYQVHEGITSVSFGMSVNLYDGGKTTAELKSIDIEEKKLSVEERKLKDDIKLELERYYLDFFNAKERLEMAKNALKQAEENLRITKIRYREGVGTGTDVLDAIAALGRSEMNYYKAIYDLLRAEAGILHATGRNLEEEYSK